MSNKKQKKKGGRLWTAAVTCIAVIAAGSLGFSAVMKYEDRAIEPGDFTPVTVTIPSGSGTLGIGRILEENGLIKSANSFRLQSKLKGMDGRYKAGAYTLSPSYTTTQIMNILISGDADTIRFTIPEGLTIAQTMERLSAKGLINNDMFLKEIESGQFDYPFLKDAPSGASRLEGYLYPNTYDVFATASEHDIIDRMLKELNRIFTAQLYDRAEALGKNLNEVMTIASLIERESRVDSERALISSVIYNRLEKGMPLQIDATVQYALGEQKEFLTYQDLEIDSPYNTYKVKGLPPGPICSPGEASIRAALYPENTDYLYYVLSKEKDGSHRFAANYEQFLIYKNEYKQAFGLS